MAEKMSLVSCSVLFSCTLLVVASTHKLDFLSWNFAVHVGVFVYRCLVMGFYILL